MYNCTFHIFVLVYQPLALGGNPVEEINIISYISFGQMGVYGGVFGWALCYKPEGHRFDS
jgi:hypothetical protein